MRAKSETRRRAILEAASEVFQEMGFERATMAAICERLGYSKATLYNYFSSKEELFSAVAFGATEIEFQATLSALNTEAEDMTEALESFGRGLLTLLYSPEVQAVRRLIVAESGRSELGRQCYELGPVRSEAALASFLEEAMKTGKLRHADARVASLHLRALLESELLDRFLFQTMEQVSTEDIRGMVQRAVAMFMAAYGPG